MTIKIKGIKGFKGFKFITQIFFVKEREIEIGYPTNVKHVAHIGWDGVSGTPPSWMNQFNPGPDFNTFFNANQRDSNSTATNPWSSQECDMPIDGESPLSADVSNTTKKKQRRKKKASSSVSNSSVSSQTSSRSKYSKEPKSGF